MLVRDEPAVSWLRRERRTVDLAQYLMSAHFDLEGALDAGQLGLAWTARGELLTTAAEIHLRARGVEPAAGSDSTESVCLLLDLLARIDAPLAAQVWSLLEEAAPDTGDGMGEAVGRALGFMGGTLAVPSAVSRAAAVRAWADRVKRLRSVAKTLGGMAQSDDWYLSESDPDDRLDWYDEVLGTLIENR